MSDETAVANSVLDWRGLPLPDIERREPPKSGRVKCRTDIGLQRLIRAAGGFNEIAAALSADRCCLHEWLAGTEPIALRYIDPLIALARQQAAELTALAVRLDTIDRPVLEARRRIVNQRRREQFKLHLGYYPEENQVMRRTFPPSGDVGKRAPVREQPRKKIPKNF